MKILCVDPEFRFRFHNIYPLPKTDLMSKWIEVHFMVSGEPEQIAPFHFCLDVGGYTGISAASYEDFLTGIKQVKAKSLSFHLQRRDFQKWVVDILKDKKLAKDIAKVRKQKLRGQALRNRLYRIVYERHKELKSKSH